MYSGLLLQVRDLLIRVLDDRRKRVDDVEADGVRRPPGLERRDDVLLEWIGNGMSGGGGETRSAL